MTKSIQREITTQLNRLVAEVKKEQLKDLLTKKDIMKILHVSLSTVDRWMHAGVLKAFGIEGRVYFKREDVEAMLSPIN